MATRIGVFFILFDIGAAIIMSSSGGKDEPSRPHMQQNNLTFVALAEVEEHKNMSEFVVTAAGAVESVPNSAGAGSTELPCSSLTSVVFQSTANDLSHERLHARTWNRLIRPQQGRMTVLEYANRFTTPCVACFVLCILLGNLIRVFKPTRNIPESATTVFVAIFLGLGLKILSGKGVVSFSGIGAIDSAVLNLALLPIIIFSGGWCLESRGFLSQLEHILNFAIVGTVISAVVVMTLTYAICQAFERYSVSVRECLVFGILISAVDPVATLNTFNKVKMDQRQPLLNTLVFGESVINDAVVIVFYNIVNTSSDVEGTLHRAVECAIEVSVQLFVSMLVGCFGASALVLGMRLASKVNAPHLTLYVYTCAFFIYTATESLKLSGIIATLFSGIIFRRYGAPHMHDAETCTHFLGLSAHFADNVVFLICGTCAGLIDSWDSLIFGGVACLCVLMGRATSVIACSAPSNALKHAAGDTNVITMKHQIAMTHSGLRGGIALVLSLTVNGELCPNKNLIIDATFIVICTLLMVCGSTTEPMLNYLGFGESNEDDECSTVVLKRPDNFMNNFGTWLDGSLTHLLVGQQPSQFKQILGSEGRASEEEADRKSVV